MGFNKNWNDRMINYQTNNHGIIKSIDKGFIPHLDVKSEAKDKYDDP
jgi:hypothetical protein